MPRRPVVSVLAALVAAALLVGLAAPPAAAADAPPQVDYSPPVPAAVLEAFDLPDQPWMAGNRGVDYATAAGDPVRAAAAGEVVFAGPVAGALHVTVRHADGLRTSYSFLAEVAVHVGQRVEAGQSVGTAGGPVHVGVRTPDGTYLDPEALFAGRLHPRVVLVPGTDDGLDPLAERRSLLDVVLDGGAAAVAHLQATGGDLVELAAHYAGELDLTARVGRAVEAGLTWWDQLQDCTPPGVAPPAPEGRRIVVVVSGLGTGSDGNSAWELDTAALGYADADVVRFSYAGGQAPGLATAVSPDAGAGGGGDPTRLVRTGAPGLAGIAVGEFSARDSQQPLGRSGDRLAHLLSAVAEAEPGVPIDVIAHSQGGVVARLGVVTAAESGTLPDEVENLVTLGSPHQGAPLATGVVLLGQTPAGDRVLDGLRGTPMFADLDQRLPAIGELSEISPTLATMRDLPVPEGVRFTSIGSAGDLTVPGTATADPQADTHLILPALPGPDAHGDLTVRADVQREVALAVAGAPPTCQSLVDAAAGFLQSEVVRTGETVVAVDAFQGTVVVEVATAAVAPALAALDDG